MLKRDSRNLTVKLEYRLTAYVGKDLEKKLYVAVVPRIPGAHTQIEVVGRFKETGVFLIITVYKTT